MLKRFISCLVFAIALAGTNANASEPSVFKEEWQKRLVDVDGVMRYSIEVGEAIGVEALIIKKGEVILHQAYGVEDIDTQKPLAPGAIWSVKSMTKPVVALAILMLVEEGKLSLHEPISTWLPDFAGDHRVTVEDLLSHRSGVTGLGGRFTKFETVRQMVEAWGSEPPTGAMGEFRYSDFNFAVATLIIADRSGMTAEEFIERRILLPLGMNDSYLSFSPEYSWAARVPSRYAKNNGVFEEIWDQRDAVWYKFFPGAWGLWTTAKDYAKFMQFWLDQGSIDGRQLIDPSLIGLALTPHTRQVEGRWSYGLGWRLHGSSSDRTGPAAFAHGGFDGTQAYGYPEAGTIALILTHSQGTRLFTDALGEIFAVRDLGTKSPSYSMMDDIKWSSADIEETKAAWVGHYVGAAYQDGNARKTEIAISSDGDGFRFEAKTNTPTSAAVRSGLFFVDNEQKGWFALERDGAPFYIERDRHLILDAAGRLVLQSGEDVLVDAFKQP